MKLLITGAWKCSELELNSIVMMGFDVCFLQFEDGDLPIEPEVVEGVICNSLFLYHDIKRFKKLKYIQTTSAGLDRIPLDYCKKNCIIVNNAKGVYSIPMAEFAISGIFDLLKERRYFFQNQDNHIWEKNRKLIELNGKTVLVVGCGNVGIECAKRLSAFGTTIIGIDTFIVEHKCFSMIYGTSKLCELLRLSDIVILTLPLNDETKHFFDKEKFDAMKNDSILVNISRGQIVVESDLLDALKSKLFGAVLDVFEEEPLPKESEFWQLKNVIISPHNSFVSDKNSKRLFNVIVENLKTFMRGEK